MLVVLITSGSSSLHSGTLEGPEVLLCADNEPHLSTTYCSENTWSVQGFWYWGKTHLETLRNTTQLENLHVPVYLYFLYKLILLNSPGGLFLRWACGSSGSAKMLEAILFLRTAGFSSSVPKQMLESPPGGRRTLEKTHAFGQRDQRFH